MTVLLSFSDEATAAGGEQQHSTIKITLNFKRFVFDPQKMMIQ